MVKTVARLGYAAVIFLALVGIASVIGRFASTLEFLTDADFVDVREAPPGAADFNGRYYEHPYLTLVHVVAGLLFMVLGPIQFWPAVRNRWIRFHRFSGRVFFVASLAGVISALAFVPMLPVFGSFSTKVGVVVAGVAFLICLVQGYVCIRRREIALHREWMIRTFAIGLGIS